MKRVGSAAAALPDRRIISHMINNQIPRPGQGAAVLPWAKPKMLKAMLKIAGAIGGPVDLYPGRRFPRTDNAILLEAGRLLFAGTRTASGIGLFDYVEAAQPHGFDMLLVRCCDDDVTYDICLHQLGRWYTGYRRAYADGVVRFCPPAHSDLPYIDATARGLVVRHYVPLIDRLQFDAGASLVAQDAREWEHAA